LRQWASQRRRRQTKKTNEEDNEDKSKATVTKKKHLCEAYWDLTQKALEAIGVPGM
jgi:hypothetical protein